MDEVDLSRYKVPDLLRLYSELMLELEKREVVRTANNPAGGYAERLVADALGLDLVPNSQRYDAKGPDDKRYEIKSVRKNSKGRAPQFSAFRNLDARHFDYFVGVAFERDFRVERAVVIPFDAVVTLLGSLREHTNGYTLHNDARLWNAPAAIDITDRLRKQQELT